MTATLVRAQVSLAIEIKNSIYRGQNSLSRLLNRIINILISKGKKSKKKGKKTSAEIVECTKLKKTKLTAEVT